MTGSAAQGPIALPFLQQWHHDQVIYSNVMCICDRFQVINWMSKVIPQAKHTAYILCTYTYTHLHTHLVTAAVKVARNSHDYWTRMSYTDRHKYVQLSHWYLVHNQFNKLHGICKSLTGVSLQCNCMCEINSGSITDSRLTKPIHCGHEEQITNANLPPDCTSSWWFKTVLFPEREGIGRTWLGGSSIQGTQKLVSSVTWHKSHYKPTPL